MSVAADLAPATVGSVRRALAARLRRAWGDGDPSRTPALDARIIVAAVLGIDAGRVPMIDDRAMDAAAQAEAELLLVRRLAGEPIARLLGHREFWGLSFDVSGATLVPRPDTETVVAVMLEALRARGLGKQAIRLLDLGTGSGCILLALLSELPDAFGVGIDLAPAAVETARRNADRLGLGGRAAFVNGSWADAISGGYAGIVANPPYIRWDDIAGLPAEVRDHDPLLALNGGMDGLTAYRHLIPELPRLLTPSGVAVMEVGAGQADDVGALGSAQGLSTRVEPDLAGIDRVVVLTRA